ncbi:MAG: prolyl oligopeptidase family serine peptidase [Phycisphaerales bacterium JB043]
MGPARLRRLAIGAALLGLASSAHAQPDRITTSDVLKIKHINAIDIAPDRSRVVYVVRSIVENDDGYSYRNDLWSIDLTANSAEPMLLTSGEEGGTSPVISPDSTTLAFVRTGQEDEEGEGTPQIWTLSLTGPGEATQLTTLEHGASSPRWFPDGASLLVSSSIPESEIQGEYPYKHERPGREFRDAEPDDDTDASPSGDRESIRRWLSNNAAEENPSVITRLDFQGEHSLEGEESHTHLFRVDARTGEHEQLTDGFVAHSQARISPDGTTIAWVGIPPGDQHPDRWERSSIYLLDIDAHESSVALDNRVATFSAPRFTSDGETIVFNYADAYESPARWGAQTRVGVSSLIEASDSHAPDWFEKTDKMSPHARGLRVRDGRVYFTRPLEGSVQLHSQPIFTKDAPRTLTSGPIGVQNYDVEGATIIASVTSASNPSELFRISTDGTPVQLTSHNDWINQKQLSLPTEHWVEQPDGTRVQYWVMEPIARESGKKYPTALEIHGGPSAMWGPGERTMWHEFQLLASWGYGVVYSNPRGSSGYGYTFQHANYQDWGHGPTSDVLGALDDAASRYAWIDTDQLVVTGGSYAGYLTAWIVTQDHRFKAAVAQRGVYDLDVFFGEGNAWRLDPWAMGGYPWDDAADVLERESPFTYVDQIRTPLLIMHASNDLRTGVSQSEMLYRALKVLERPVEYVRYPNAGHNLSRTGDPTQRMDRLNRIIEFFERHVDNDTPAPVDISASPHEED